MKQGNGSIYWGDWKEGRAHGHGVYYCAIEQSLYEGDWHEDQ